MLLFCSSCVSLTEQKQLSVQSSANDSDIPQRLKAVREQLALGKDARIANKLASKKAMKKRKRSAQ